MVHCNRIQIANNELLKIKQANIFPRLYMFEKTLTYSPNCISRSKPIRKELTVTGFCQLKTFKIQTTM